jgi:GntR family transcriptional regulator, transcriptional repressor for pyruvate dehydrogenase complex
MARAVQTPKLADAIANHLERLILEGALRPGEKLAPERELAEKLEVSRPSLREALDKLSRRGLLETNRGRTFVAEFLKPLADPLAALFRENDRVLPDYFEFREVLESKACALAARRATDPERDAIRACIDKMSKAHKLDDPTQEAKVDVDLHMLFYESAHNVVLLHIMRSFSSMLRQGIFYSREKFYRSPGVRECLLAQHTAIANAVLAGDAKAAEKAATDHIQYTAEVHKLIREDEMRLDAALRRFGRSELLSNDV